MATVKSALRYLRRYGLGNSLTLAMEKWFIDKRRFSPKKERRLPSFDMTYERAEKPTLAVRDGLVPLSVMYLIHYFYPKKKGGTERFTLNLAKQQAALGNKPFVLVLEANESNSIYTERYGDILWREYEYDGVDCIAFSHKKAPRGLYYKTVSDGDTALADFAEFIVRRKRIDVVHATYPQPFASFLLRMKQIGVPYIVTCTDFCMMCHYATMVDKKGDFCKSAEGGKRCAEICSTWGCPDFEGRTRVAKTVLSGAELVTVPSEFVAKIIGAEFKGVRILPVAHGISDSFTFARREGGVKRFVYAGTLSMLKGIHLLIEEFVKLEGEDLSLEIYGDGNESYKKQLARIADGRVRFMGAVPGEKMPGIYSAADCVIVPSMWYETYNFVLREALMTGALVISADIGAMPEAVDVGENGFLFTASDAASLGDALRQALEFDFDKYKRRDFPSLCDEAEIYFAAYHAAIAKKAAPV